MEDDFDELHAFKVASTILFGALIQTHQNPRAFQLLLTTGLEQQLGGGALGRTLTPQQREYVREVVEQLQMIEPAPPLPPPLKL